MTRAALQALPGAEHGLVRKYVDKNGKRRHVGVPERLRSSQCWDSEPLCWDRVFAMSLKDLSFPLNELSWEHFHVVQEELGLSEKETDRESEPVPKKKPAARKPSAKPKKTQKKDQKDSKQKTTEKKSKDAEEKSTRSSSSKRPAKPVDDEAECPKKPKIMPKTAAKSKAGAKAKTQAKAKAKTAEEEGDALSVPQGVTRVRKPLVSAEPLAAITSLEAASKKPRTEENGCETSVPKKLEENAPETTVPDKPAAPSPPCSAPRQDDAGSQSQSQQTAWLGSQEQPELLALSAALARIKVLEAQVSKESPSGPSPLRRSTPLTPASVRASEDDDVVVVMEKQPEFFQDAQSPSPYKPWVPDESLPATIPGTLPDGDSSQPPALEPVVPVVASEQSSVVVMPAAEDAKTEEKALEREELLKNANKASVAGSQPAPAEEPDWKLGAGRVEHAEKLCAELDEDQIGSLMQKFSSAASAKGEVGTIEIEKLSASVQMNFFTMLEEMVHANRKKLSAAQAACEKSSQATEVSPKQVAQAAKTALHVPSKEIQPSATMPAQDMPKPIQPSAMTPVQEVPKEIQPSAMTPVQEVPKEIQSSATMPAQEVPKEIQSSATMPAQEVSQTLPVPKQIQLSATAPTLPAAPKEIQPSAMLPPQQPAVPLQEIQTSALVPSQDIQPSQTSQSPTPFQNPQKNSEAVLAQLPPAALTVPAAGAAVASPPDRTLELAGLQALMQAQKGREAQQLQQAVNAPRVHLTPASEKVDWSTHKKEGMRLKRLMEESSEGDKFPHMKKLFNEGSKEDMGIRGWMIDRRKLLRQWVESGCNPADVEAQVVVERAKDHTVGRTRELLSVQDMVAKGFPQCKIQSIISRGGGVPDEDAPEIPELMRFWVCTSTQQTDQERFSQRATATVQAQADGSFIDGVFGDSSMVRAGNGSLGAAAVSQLMNQMAPGTTEPVAKAKAKARGKAKAKAKALPGGAVVEEAAKTVDQVKGSALKKELRAIADIALEMPSGNAIKTTLVRYKVRFEELLEESLGLQEAQALVNEGYIEALMDLERLAWSTEWTTEPWTQANLGWKSNAYPETHCKGYDSYVMVAWLDWLLSDADDVDLRIRSMVWAAHSVMGVWHHAGMFLSDNEVQHVQIVGGLFIRCYLELAEEAVRSKTRLWRIRPKFHLLVHLQSELRASKYNPTYGSTWMDEDAVKRFMKIKKKVHRLQAPDRVIRRWETASVDPRHQAGVSPGCDNAAVAAAVELDFGDVPAEEAPRSPPHALDMRKAAARQAGQWQSKSFYHESYAFIAVHSLVSQGVLCGHGVTLSEVIPAVNFTSAMGTPSHGYDPRESVYAAKLQDLHQPAAIPVISRSNIDSECIWERRDRLNAERAKREEQRLLRQSQQVQDVFADRLHQRPLADARRKDEPSGSDQRPSWARPKPSIRMPRSMAVKPMQGYCLPQWSTPSYEYSSTVADRTSPESEVSRGGASASSAARRPCDLKGNADTSTGPEDIALPDAKSELNKDMDTSRAEVRQLMNGEVELEDLSPRLRSDREAVAAAVHADGHALQHASEDLRADRELVLAAVRENGLALSHATKELCDDEDVVLAAVKQNGMALQHTSPALRSHRPVLLAALAQTPQAARFVPRELLDDRDFVISATSFSRRIFEKASFRLKRDLDVVLEVVDHDPECFMFAAWELRCDRRSVKEVVSCAGCAIAHASPELKQDPEILAVAIANDPMARAAAKS
eukprot:s1178_g8.t1